MNVGKSLEKVLDVFAGTYEGNVSSWKDGENDVYYYPFLVITESANGTRGAWLPYWHVTEDASGHRTATKYGQWAPSMDLSLFSDLVGKARARGYV